MKKRFIACVVACAMLLMGTGYAYWTDLLNVKATAETGKLDVDFTSATYEGNNFKATGELRDEAAYDSTKHTVGTNGDNMTIGIEELYPGHYQAYAATVDNFGTVAAKLGKVTAQVTGDNATTKSMIGIAVCATTSYDTKRHYVCGCHDVTVTQFAAVSDWDAFFKLPKGSTFVIDNKVVFVRLSALKDLTTFDNLLYITNNSKANFNVLVGMDPDAFGNLTSGSSKVMATKTPDRDSQHKTAEVTLGFIWDQYNQK